MAVTFGKGSFKGFEPSDEGGTIYHHKDGANAQKTSLTTIEHLPPDVVISNNLQTMSLNVQQLKKLIGMIGTTADSREVRKNVRSVQDDMKRLTKDTSELIKKYSKLDENADVDEEKYDMYKVKERRLKESFHDVLKDYKELQKDIKIRMRDSIRSSLIKSGYHDLEVQDDGTIVKNGQEVQLEQIQAEVELSLIREREEALKQLEEDIRDINDIFKQISTMVAEQGEVIAEAEEKVEEATINIEEATEEVEIALNYTNEARKKCIMIGVVVSVVLVVVVTIIVVVSLKT